MLTNKKELKSLAFKASNVAVDDSYSSDDDDLLSDDEKVHVVTKGIAMFLVSCKNKTGVKREKHKFANTDASKVPCCYKCSSKGYIKPACPLVKKDVGKGKGLEAEKSKTMKGMMAISAFGTLGHSATKEMSLSNDEAVVFKNGTCFMANGEINSNSASDNELDDIYSMFDSAYEVLVYFAEHYNDLSAKYMSLKNQKIQLESDLDGEKCVKEEMTNFFF